VPNHESMDPQGFILQNENKGKKGKEEKKGSVRGFNYTWMIGN